MNNKYTLLIALIINATSSFAEVQNLNPKNIVKDIISETVTKYRSDHFLNATYLFADSKNILTKGASGIFKLDGKNLNDNQEMFIASNTKPFTAAAILKLQDKKMLNVNDLVFTHLKDVWVNQPPWAKTLTIHHLLTHTSGIEEYFMRLPIDAKMAHSQINQLIANFASITRLKFEPGKDYYYSSTNYVLLGLIIEKVSKQELGQFFKQELFEPSQMKNSHLATLEEAISVQKHENDEYPTNYFVIPTGGKAHFELASINNTVVPYADGGIVSTTDDLVKFHQNLHHGKVLSKDSYQLMTKQYIAVPNDYGKKMYSGYGIYVTSLPNNEIMYQSSGKAVGIRSEVGFVPSKDLYYAVISNTMQIIPDEIKDKIDLKDVHNQLDIFYLKEAVLDAVLRNK